MALQSIFQHKLRSCLSILGIICGVMAVLTMISIGEGAKHNLLLQIEQLGTKNIYIKKRALTKVQKKNARERLSSGLGISDVDRIRSGCDTVSAIAVLREVRATILGIGSENTPPIIASSANYAEVMGFTVQNGRFITPMDIRENKMVCVIGNSLAERLGLKGKTGNFIRLENQLFKIVGRLKGFKRKEGTGKKMAISVRDYNEMIIIPLGLDGIINDWAEGDPNMNITGDISEMIVQVKHPEGVFSAGKIIDRIINIAHGGVSDYLVLIPRELLRQAQQTQRTFNLVLGTIAGVSLLVGGIGIMNIMLASVYERTREIGIRRAVGATRLDIVQHFLTESVILTLTGGIAGVLMGTITSILVSHIGQWATRITLWAVLGPVIMAILVGVFFGLYPAVQASRMDPIKALRYE